MTTNNDDFFSIPSPNLGPDVGLQPQPVQHTHSAQEFQQLYQNFIQWSNPVPPTTTIGVQAGVPVDLGHSHNPAIANYSGQPDSYYFSNPAHAEYFRQKRQSKQQYNKIHGLNPWWTEDMEIELVNSLFLSWYGEPWQEGGGGWDNSYPALDLDKIEPSVQPKRKMAPFKIDYQTYHEAKLRLMQTVILINGSPFYVHRIRPKGESFILGVYKEPNDIKTVKLSDIKDLRSIPPMYVTTNSTGWLCRHPGRVYQQGLNRGNTHLRTVDGTSMLYNIDSHSLIRAIDRRQDKKWHSSYQNLMEDGELGSVRLSDEIAISGSRVVACYKGRRLGCVKDGEIVVDDEDDLIQGWIEKSAKSVGLELRAA